MNEYRMYDGDMSIIPNDMPDNNDINNDGKVPGWFISLMVVAAIFLVCIIVAISVFLGTRISGKLAQYAYKNITGNNIVVTVPAFNQDNSIGALDSVVNIESQNEYGDMLGQKISVGSGAIVREDGLILTSIYAVDSEGDITVRLNSGEKYKATLYQKDVANGIAMLKIEANDLVPIKIGDSDAVKIGDAVVVIGNTVDERFSNPITYGNISGIEKGVEVDGGKKVDLFQVDSGVLADSVGGLLLNQNGELIGISTGIFKTNAGDIGVVTPINNIKNGIDMNDEASTGEAVEETPMIGISGIDSEHGVVIEIVEKDSPADKAGLKRNDLIVKVNGNTVTMVDEINSVKNSLKKGDSIKLTVYRNGEMLEIDVVL